MKAHAFDATSFIFGVVLGAAGIGFLLAEQYEWDIDGRWVLPAALIALGVAGIAGAISGLLPGRDSAESAVSTDAADTGDPVTDETDDDASPSSGPSDADSTTASDQGATITKP